MRSGLFVFLGQGRNFSGARPIIQQAHSAPRGSSDMSNETLHLFKECSGGDTYAARDLGHAKALWKEDTGQDPDDGTEWEAIPDDASIKVDDDGVKVTKTAAEWANELDGHGRNNAGCCFGENY